MKQETNNTFTITGQVMKNWESSLNPEYDEKYLLVRTTDSSGKYTNDVKILVGSFLMKKINCTFDVDLTGRVVEVKGYINGRYYENSGKHFQTLKASYLKIEGTDFKQVPKQDDSISVYDIEDDLPF